MRKRSDNIVAAESGRRLSQDIRAASAKLVKGKGKGKGKGKKGSDKGKGKGKGEKKWITKEAAEEPTTLPPHENVSLCAYSGSVYLGYP